MPAIWRGRTDRNVYPPKHRHSCLFPLSTCHPRTPTVSAPIRILHVVISLDAGGMENGIVNLANTLAGDFTIQVVCLEARGRMAERIEYPGTVRVLHKPPGFSTKTIWSLTGEIRRFRPHLLHTHNLGPLIYGSLATAFGRTVPILHGEHSQLSPEDLGPRRLAERRIFFRSARQVHTVSQNLVQQLLAQKLGLTPDRIQAVVNGVDTARFLPAASGPARRPLNIPPDAPVIGIVGRFGPHKRHDLLIQAFEAIRARGSPAHLLVIGGGGPEEERVRRLSQTSPEAAAIHLTGFTGHPESLYPAMNLLAIPSVNEGLSNVALEAMACGIPVLSHPSCGSLEVICPDANGVVADLSSADRLARELEALLSTPDRLRAMGDKARRSIAEKFSLDRMARDYADLYRKMSEE